MYGIIKCNSYFKTDDEIMSIFVVVIITIIY